MSVFPERLKNLRLKNKISQAKVATDIGISDTQYQRYEYGESEPTLSVIIDLIRYFKVSPGWLMGLSDDPTPPKWLSDSHK